MQATLLLFEKQESTLSAVELRHIDCMKQCVGRSVQMFLVLSFFLFVFFIHAYPDTDTGPPEWFTVVK